MKPTTWHAVQAYVRTKKGRMGMAPLQPCQSAESARRLAERLVENGAAIGAQALSRRVDVDEGEYDDPEITATFGQVPADASDLPF